MSAFSISTLSPWINRSLIGVLTRREVTGRYRGSLFGSLWALLTPLLMLAVFTLVFGVVLTAKWPDGAGDGTTMVAIRLLSGMVVHGLLAEALGRAPVLVTGNPNYVTKVVFPLEVLGWVAVLATLVHVAAAVALLVLANGIWGSGLALPQVAIPLLLLPLAVLVLGLCLVFAALGVFFRDLAQLTGPLVTVSMFLGPVFFPRSAMPEALQPWLVLNPITVPIEQLRRVLFQGRWPEWDVLAAYTLAALLIYCMGVWVFSSLKKGFADVL